MTAFDLAGIVSTNMLDNVFTREYESQTSPKTYTRFVTQALPVKIFFGIQEAVRRMADCKCDFADDRYEINVTKDLTGLESSIRVNIQIYQAPGNEYWVECRRVNGDVHKFHEFYDEFRGSYNETMQRNERQEERRRKSTSIGNKRQINHFKKSSKPHQIQFRSKNSKNYGQNIRGGRARSASEPQKTETEMKEEFLLKNRTGNNSTTNHESSNSKSMSYAIGAAIGAANGQTSGLMKQNSVNSANSANSANTPPVTASPSASPILQASENYSIVKTRVPRSISNVSNDSGLSEGSSDIAYNNGNLSHDSIEPSDYSIDDSTLNQLLNEIDDELDDENSINASSNELNEDNNNSNNNNTNNNNNSNSNSNSNSTGHKRLPSSGKKTVYVTRKGRLGIPKVVPDNN